MVVVVELVGGQRVNQENILEANSGVVKMWLRVLTAVVSLTAQVLSQQSYLSQKLQQSGAGFEWGWHLPPLDGNIQLDHYYLQPEQQFLYTNAGVFQNVGNLPSGGIQQVDYNSAIPIQLYQDPPNNTNIPQGNLAEEDTAQSPVNFYYLQPQYPTQELQTLQSGLPGDLIRYTNTQQNLYSPNPLHAGFSIQTQHPLSIKEAKVNYKPQAAASSTPTPKGSGKESISPIVQVFKDHNCSDDDIEIARDYNSDMRKTIELSAELPSYDASDVSAIFGARDRPKQTQKSSTDAKIERPRGNTNNEGYYYYTTEVVNIAARNEDQEGISRLVASTQDLITNDDLLRINHSAEKHISDVNDDYIKPQPRNSFKSESNGYNQSPRKQITVRAKINKIEDRAVEYSDQATEKNEQEFHNTDRFTSPIIVKDSTDEDFGEQVIDTIVSTMAPYLDNGYEIVSVTQRNDTKTYVPRYLNEETVYVTPRPVGQKYLAPITVALRLLNSNHTESFNSIDDHDASDTELIEETVNRPQKDRTVVEIQQSIPVDITHINEVEVHEYMEEGRSNPNSFDLARNLYDRYMKALEVERQNEENRSRAIKNYVNSSENGDSHISMKEDNQDAEDKLEPSENIQSDVRVSYNNNDNNKQHIDNYYDKRNDNNGKAIQPIIIEKEVPHYVDRYIEKQVPYPEPVEVVKHVPVDRPVPVPVPYEKVVEKPVEVTKYVDKPYPIRVPQPYPVPIKVPYPVQQKVYVDRPVHIPYPVEKIVEKQVFRTVPVPTPIAVPVNVQVPVEIPVVEKPAPVERIVHKEVPVPYPVEKKILYPLPYERTIHVPYPVEKRVPVPVEKVVEKPVPVTQVYIVKQYPVDRVVEKNVPYVQQVDRIVEKQVQMRVPYPIGKVVEKPVMVPYFVEKIAEKELPYAVQAPYTNTAYNYDVIKQESQNLMQYQKIANQTPNSVNSKQNHQIQQQQDHPNQYYQGSKQNHQNKANAIPVQTTLWGNLYASSYTYINATDERKNGEPPYHREYVTRNDNYYGPPPMRSYDSMWEKNNAYILENKRTDRAPKMANLRIEYGGFKPPLIPSTEVDLDGRPIDKGADT
ncbi:unnamed protein product, partial [Iphiclides podalirius]